MHYHVYKINVLIHMKKHAHSVLKQCPHYREVKGDQPKKN